MHTGLAVRVLLMAAFLFLFAVAAKGQSIATEKVTLSLKNESMETAIKRIEQQSALRVFYRDEDILPLAHLNLAQGTRTIEQTLDILLQNTFLSFRQIDGHILLERKKQQAYLAISGRVLNQADTKPVADASVFLSGTTTGDKTAADGTFTLRNVPPGKYDLIVSELGFESYDQTIIISNENISLPGILIFPKTIGLHEVVIRAPLKPDVNRERNYEWFYDQFLGTSKLTKQCKILNPEVLDLDYDEQASTLTASSSDFLEIENKALGYKIRYLLTNFLSVKKDAVNSRIYYQGFVFFEEMKGSAAQEREWQKRRLDVFENSEMHFLRSVVTIRIEDEGFRVQQLAVYANPERPGDSLIEAKINYYKKLEQAQKKRPDSLSYWVKKSKLPKTHQKWVPFPLKSADILTGPNKKGIYALGCDNDGLLVTYNKSHHFGAGNLNYINDPRNTESTLINFASPFAFFYANGVISNPYSVLYFGVWGNQRIAELLPTNYDPGQKDGKEKAAVDSAVVKNITGKLKNYSADHITERAYLHFDKPYYAAGDTIYFKAYITSGEKHELSEISGVLNVELVNADNKVDQSIKMPIIDGVCWGDFALPDTMAKGSYRVRAYTRWMFNVGDDRYFDQAVPIGSIQTDNVPIHLTTPTHPLAINKPDIQFFPEGGGLVTGIKSKVAFKAVGSDGLGINIKGEILDNDNNQAATFASAHLGMGDFDFLPHDGKTYRAKTTYPNGSSDTVNMPQAEANGIALSVNNEPETGLLIKVSANNTFYKKNKNKDYSLVIYSGGEVSPVICKLDSPVITIDLLKQTLHTGVASVTLFSPSGEPLAERLVFIQNNDRLNININSNKAIYTQREKVNLKINVTDMVKGPSMGHFSVSVIDESKVPDDENKENTILTNLLLTADLKGYVEQPNYYFSNISSKTSDNLDLVMLTHGYRRFEWKPLLNNEYPPVKYQLEKSLEIAGIVTAPNGKSQTKGTASLFPMNGGPVLSQELREDGTFRFSNLAFFDSSRFVIKAVNDRLKSNTRITLDTEKPAPLKVAKDVVFEPGDVNTRMHAYLENRKIQEDEITKYKLLKGIVLKEVKVKGVKKENDYRSSNIGGPGFADQVIRRGEFTIIGGLFSEQFFGRLIGVKFVGGIAYLNLTTSIGINGPTAMLIVLDGVPMSQEAPNPFSVDEINVNDIETIEVLTSATASIYGMSGAAGVLVITTRRGSDLDAVGQSTDGILVISPKGFYKARTFYSPKYDHIEDAFTRKDLRSTIYWEPELVTDKDGNASLDYYNADGTGTTYRITIEGIDVHGNLGRQVFRYKVE